VTLRELLASGGHFQGYAYAYPHKTAYRPLDPPIPLAEAWAAEDKSSLFLYVHLPFCEMRCGFCNLFTTTRPASPRVTQYLDTLARQFQAVVEALGPSARFARLAVGGGTPTFLTPTELAQLFQSIEGHFRGLSDPIPKAIECSPATVDRERIAVLLDHDVTRASLGVQSFVDGEVRALGRRQRAAEVRHALALLTAAGFPCVNVDLIYGIPGQTQGTWRQSLEQALEFAPQEIYLYPLYIRPLTGLDRSGLEPGDERLEFYRAGRDFLLARGYRQISMRLFRASCYAPPEGPVYCCQEDGMVGLGAGARSYTRLLHYSTEYAVGRAGVEAILAGYLQRPTASFGYADYGCRLDAGEQRRRYVLKSLLRIDGLDLADYQAQFGSTVFDDLPQLLELEGLADQINGQLRLTELGLELSDVIGPWLSSPAMQDRMKGFALA
jgi:coproporphyrinogen III oxidase-like Fe-S oxidoreductase